MKNYGSVAISDGTVQSITLARACLAILLYSPIPITYSVNVDQLTSANAEKTGYHPGGGQVYIYPKGDEITKIYVKRASGLTGTLYAEETQDFNGVPGQFIPSSRPNLTLALGSPAAIRLAGFPGAAGDNNGHGSSSDAVVLFKETPAVDTGGTDMSDTYSATAGSKITLATAGVYRASANLALGEAGTAYLCQGTPNNTLQAGHIRAKAKGAANSVLSFGAEIIAEAGDILYIHCAANLESPNTNDTDNQLIVTGPYRGPTLSLA